jgi:hypothetical protein
LYQWSLRELSHRRWRGTIPLLYELRQREAAWRQLAGSLARQLTERLILADAAKHTKA